MLKTKHLYHGRGAELATKAEIVVRGYNVADPEVEHGIDFHVYPPISGSSSSRVEVKSGTAECHFATGRWRCRFTLSPSNMADDADPELIFVFAARFPSHWQFIIISRQELLARLPPEKATPHPYRDLALRFDFTPTTVHGPGPLPYTDHHNNWSRYWPRLS